MSISIFSAAQTGNMLDFAVCPHYANATCECPKDADGKPVPPHPAFQFSATVPAGDTRTAAEWAQACAGEAVLLVQASQPAAPVDLTSLVGLT